MIAGFFSQAAKRSTDNSKSATTFSSLYMAAKKLLVTTSLECTWREPGKIIFLGEWCKTYDRRHVWGAVDHETIPFHWDDREKLKKDYIYLQDLHHLLIKTLAESLNNLHQVDYSDRYWQILLDPWLMAYIGVLFDRWESLRIAFENHEELEVITSKKLREIQPPWSYSEFIEQATSDIWNHALYLRIIEKYYSDRCLISECAWPSDFERQNENVNQTTVSRKTLKSKALLLAEKLLGRVIKNYDFVFVGSYFGIVPLIRLNISLGQIPRLFLNEFKVVSSNEFSKSVHQSGRANIRLKFHPNSQFEKFIIESIHLDLPSCVMEGYHSLREKVASLPIKTKAIVTAMSHCTNVLAKAWIAEQVAKDAKLVILEHGGSFPAPKELFDFEEDISDVRGTWFLPYHPKHRRVPPSRLIGRFKKSRPFSLESSSGSYCSVIGNECPRWVHRAHFYPMASQCMESVDLISRFYTALKEDVKACVRVKPAVDNGWNTRQIYEDLFGGHKVYQTGTIDQVFKQSRLVICTYPETTFSEAMASGVPTIMIYPEHYYERHQITFSLLELLRDLNIIFYASNAAAGHINSIWPEPEQWWNSPPIVNARKEFNRQACNLNSDWLNEWATFLRGVIA